MRKIKFRAKGTKDVEPLHNSNGSLIYTYPPELFVYGNLIEDWNGNAIIDVQNYDEYGIGQHLQYLVDRETIGQYTGMEDKNGKEIYEGDIVVVDDTPYNIYAERYKGDIVMHDGCFSIKKWWWWDLIKEHIYVPLYFDRFADRKIEVIGNIYDNPELMKIKEK